MLKATETADDAISLEGIRGQLFDSVKMRRKGNVDGEVLAD